jgi:hypothetical protein
VTKSRIVRWADIYHSLANWNVSKIVIGIPEEIFKHRWENNMKKDFKEIGCGV